MGDDERRLSGIMFGFGDFSKVDPEAAAGAEIDFSVGFDEMFERAIATARELKEAIIVDGPADIPDQCVAVLPQGSFQCPIQQMVEGLGVRAPDAIAVSMSALSQSMGRPIAVLVLLETVYRGFDAAPMPTRVGELSDAWHRGDQSIREALTVAMGTPERYAMQFMPYHYGDGSVVWDDGGRHDRTVADGWPRLDTQENVAEAIRLAFSEQEGGGDGPSQQL